MRCFRAIAVIILLILSSISAFPEMWRTYQNVNDILDIAVDGDYVWMTVKRGGILKWSEPSGMYMRYTHSKGLPDNTVNRIFKDRKGRIWAPNAMGVSCLENDQWKFYGAADGILIEYVTSIAEDKNGVLWFGAGAQGAWSFDGEKWERYWKDKWNFATNINTVVSVGNGEVLFGRDGGVVKVDGEEWSILATQDSGLPHRWVYSLLKTKNGNIWAGTYLGLSLFDGNTWKTVEGTESKGQVNDLALDSNDTVWLATFNHIQKIENGKAVTVEDGGFTSIVIASTGVKWFGSTNNGVLRLEGDTRTWYRKGENGPVINGINDLALDEKGVLWAATSSGVSRFDGLVWVKITSLDATSVCADRLGNIWIGTAQSGLYKYRDTDGSWEQYKEANSFKLDMIHSLAADDNGSIWVGASGYVARYDGESWQIFSPANTLSQGDCRKIVVDGDNRKWFLVSDSWIQSFDGRFWKGYGSSDFSRISSMGVDSNGLKWLPAGNGLYTFDENAPIYSQFVQYPPASLPLGANSFRDIFMDSHDIKWFTTLNGINRLDGKNWTHFSKSDGLQDSVINRITAADDGAIWTSSARGISRFENGRWDSFSISSNCPGNNTILSSAIDSEDRKWFGTAGGVSCYSRGEWTNFTPDDNLPNGVTSSLAVGADGSVWAGHQGISPDSRDFYGGGVSHYIGGKWETTHLNRNIDALATDRDGAVWMVYSNWGYPFQMGLAFYRDGQWNVLSLPDDFALKRCFSIAIDRNNVKWFGCQGIDNPVGTIASYDGAKFTWHTNPDLRYLLNRGIADSVWFVSTDGSMLTRYDGEKWKTFSPPYDFGYDGKNSNQYIAGENIPYYGRFITAKTDNRGYTWFGARSGLVRFDGASWKLYPDTDEFTLSHAIETIAADRNNTLWVGTTKGIAGLFESTGVEEERAFPAELVISNSPNPFNPFTTISYTLTSPGKVTLSIYDITGRKVRELAAGNLTVGTHQAVWDGTDAHGAAVASGIYFARVACGNRTATGKMLLMK